MDSSHAILSGIAFLAGWWFKGATIVKEDPVPCRCHWILKIGGRQQVSLLELCLD